MLKKYQTLIVKRYLKAFFTIFVALTVFFTGVDFASNLDKLPDSANLKVLFMLNRFLYFSSFTFSLSLMFALISSIISLIKENELVVIYSFGASKDKLLKPFLYTISFFIVVFWIFNSFNFYVNSVQIAENIRDYGRVSSYEKDLFLKSGSSYVYISKLNKYKKEGKNIEVFETDGIELKRVIKAKKGYFRDNFWLLKDVTIIKKPDLSGSILDKKLHISHKNTLEVLNGFKPTIMESLYNGDASLTLKDSVYALFFLQDKGLSTNAIKANLYKIVFFPMFSLFLGVVLFFMLPLQRRGKRLGLIMAKLYFISLLVWGVLYVMTKVSKNGSISPELGVILPVFALAVFSFYFYKKKTNSF
jgi:lipopolysaccharide export system permease protein